MTVMRRLLPTRFELAALVLAAGIGCFQLLVPPIVGRADNGSPIPAPPSRPLPNQASYPQSAGLPPGQHARSFTYWNSLRSSVVSHSLPFLCVYVLVNCVFAMAVWLWGTRIARRIAVLQGVLILILVTQFLTVSVMDTEIEVERHH
jgi:hypothetical protein